MTIDLYYSAVSAPCRAVLLAAKAIGVEFNLKSFNLFEGEQRNLEFLKLNPQHKVPTIDDNGFILSESRAIVTYLQNQYGKNDSIYPKDPKKRAVVDQRLFFDMDLHTHLHEVYNARTLAGGEVDPEKLEQFKKYLGFIDTFLEKTEYLAGDNLTLADLLLVVQISDLNVLKHDFTPYKNINRWYAKVKTTAPGYKEVIEDNIVHSHDKIPCIDDNGLVLCDGTEILTYLQTKYGKNDSLYPKDPKKRAIVDERLEFDTDLYARFHDVYTRETLAGTPPNLGKLQYANLGLELLDTILKESEYVAGKNLTLADLAFVVEISNLEVLKHDFSSYKNINRWYAKVKTEAPGYKEAVEDHLVAVKRIVEKLSQGE